MLSQIWKACIDIIFCHFRSFFPLLPHYCPQKLKFGEIVKKKLRDIILLHTCTVNQNHMHPWYDLWFLRSEVQLTELFCHLEPFLVLYPSNTPKNENIKNEKKPLKISLFYTSITKIMIIHYTVLKKDVARGRCNCYFHFGLYFSLLPPHPNKSPKKKKKKMKIPKQWKEKRRDIII